MAALTPTAKMQFFKADGTPLVGGKLYTYTAGTTTPQTTYTDSSGGTANTNPVILDSRGEANIWLGGATYKFKLADANDVEIWTVDNISAPTSGVSPALSGNVTIDTNSSSPALKITQTGTGPALRVQDSADPDLTPFVVDSTGKVGIGTISPTELLDVSGGNLLFTSSSGTAYAKITPGVSRTDISAEGARTLTLTANATLGLTVATTGALTAAVSLSSPLLTATSQVLTDTISEYTSAAGVTVDGVLIKDSLIGAQFRPITEATLQSTTSGTSVVFNDLPSWVKRITIIFNGVSFSGANTCQIRLGTGTSGSPVWISSGYVGASTAVGGTTINPTSAFGISCGSAASFSGKMEIFKLSSSVYVSSHAAATTVLVGGGGVLTGIGATITQLQIAPSGGDNFDAGSINIFYE